MIRRTVLSGISAMLLGSVAMAQTLLPFSSGPSSGGGGTPVPTLVQMVSSAGLQPNAETVTANNFSFTPQNNIGAGNCLVIPFTYGSESGPSSAYTPSISDNNGNSWPATPAVTVGGSNNTTCMFVLPNANAGTTTFTISFSADIPDCIFQYDFYEFCNVATTSPVNGTTSAGSVIGASLACGSFTPGNNNANGGNLILAFFGNLNGGTSGQPTNWVPGSGFSLLQGDTWAVAGGLTKGSMYQVQTTSASINPSITCTGDTSDHFNCVAIALKAASAGTPKPTTGIYVNKIIEVFAGGSAQPSSGVVLVPTIGNLVVMISTSGGSGGESFSDNASGTWSSIINQNALIAYSANKTPNLGLQVTIAGGAGNNGCYKIFDISGAATSPFDTSAQGFGGSTNPINNQPDITPTTSNGLVVAVQGLGQGPCGGLATGVPAAAVFLNTNYTGKIDSDSFDSGDGYGMYYNPNTSLIAWNWVTVNNSGGYYLAASFKKA